MILTTSDGYGFIVNRNAVGKMAIGVRQAGARYAPFTATDAVIRSIPPIIRRARLAKMHFQTGSGNEYPVFHSPLNGKTLEIIANHLGRGLYGIVAARTFVPDEEFEAELTEKGVHAHIDWTNPMPLEEAVNKKDRGIIYIVERPSGKPVYVGMSTKTVAERWDERMEVLRQLGLSNMVKVRIGRVSPKNIRTKQLKDLEHAVIRAIYNAAIGGPPDVPAGRNAPEGKYMRRRGDILTNMNSFLPFKVGTSGLNITQTNRPPYLQLRISQAPGRYFELSRSGSSEFQLWS